jgi:hypothetical protein
VEGQLKNGQQQRKGRHDYYEGRHNHHADQRANDPLRFI